MTLRRRAGVRQAAATRDAALAVALAASTRHEPALVAAVDTVGSQTRVTVLWRGARVVAQYASPLDGTLAAGQTVLLTIRPDGAPPFISGRIVGLTQ